MASWSVFIDNPSNLGYDGEKYILPKMNTQEIIVDGTEHSNEKLTLTERRNARRDSIELKAQNIMNLLRDKNVIA